MSKIRSKNTKPEIVIRKGLFAKGFRYRINSTKLPGKPDIVLSRYKTVIFVHGCFWHRHEGCKYAYTPKTNTEFWLDKIHSNQARDIQNKAKLETMGWKVLTVWECETRKSSNIPLVIERLESEIKRQ